MANLPLKNSPVGFWQKGWPFFAGAVLRRPSALLSGLFLLAGAGALYAASRPCPPFQNLCFSAEKSGGIDLKNGMAYLEGSVEGELRSMNLTLRSEVVKLVQTPNSQLVRLLLDREVRLSQPGRVAKADHGVVENLTGVVILFGRASLTEEPLVVAADEIRLEGKPAVFTIRGAEGAPAAIIYSGSRQGRVAAPREKNGRGFFSGLLAGGYEEQPDTFRISTDKAVISREMRRMELTGKVVVLRVEEGWRIQGHKMEFQFTSDNKLLSFKAEGNASLEQPGRKISADTIVSKLKLQRMMLTGNAKVQQEGRFDLTSDQMEVYADVNKGVVQSGEANRPLTLTIDPQAVAVYKLDEQKLADLEEQNVPQEVLGKLAPLLGRSIKGRAAMAAALALLLTEEEQQRYQETIIANAR